MKFYTSLFLLIVICSGCDKGPVKEGKNSGAEKSNQPPSYSFNNADGPQHIKPVPIPKVVTFAGEVIPVDRADVREALEEELMVNAFRHSHTLVIIKNVARWKSFVVDILKSLEVPEDFLYLAVIESEFDNNALSYAGAMGMWQIMRETAKDYGLLMTDDIDMRRDPKLATIAAAKFLKWSYSNLNSWTMAAASYNAGMKGMKDRLKSQKVDSFFDLHLNPETARYVYRIIALKLIIENPEAYGYFVPENEKYHPYKFTTVHISNDIDNLVDFAKQHSTTYKELRILNPWFNNTSNFRLKIPKNQTLEVRIPSPKTVIEFWNYRTR